MPILLQNKYILLYTDTWFTCRLLWWFLDLHYYSAVRFYCIRFNSTFLHQHMSCWFFKLSIRKSCSTLVRHGEICGYLADAFDNLLYSSQNKFDRISREPISRLNLKWIQASTTSLILDASKLVGSVQLNRLVVKKMSYVGIVNQNNITKHFNRLSKYNVSSQFYKMTRCVGFILVQVGFVCSFSDVWWLLSNNCITVNRLPINNYRYVLKIGDVLELNCSKNCQIYWQTMYTTRIHFLSKQKNRCVKKLLSKHSDLNTAIELKLIPYAFNTLWVTWALPSYLDVDLQSFSVFVISISFKLLDHNWLYWRFFVLFLIRLYNWHYLH